MHKPENQIDYIEFPAADIPRMKQFYSEAFGWKFEDYGPDYTSFTDGRLSGGFTRERPAPAAHLLIVIFASDLEAAQKRVRDAGGSVVRDTYAFPGGQRFHFTDPSGNELAVWSDAGT
jgi:predicted enzyme related to lactoylglutathione lyase